jgi:hypothetical protein
VTGEVEGFNECLEERDHTFDKGATDRGILGKGILGKGIRGDGIRGNGMMCGFGAMGGLTEGKGLFGGVSVRPEVSTSVT